MRVHTEVLGSGYIAGRVALGSLILHGVDFRVAVSEVHGLVGILGCQAFGVFELMPAPVGHGGQGNTTPVLKRERLHARYVDRSGEMAVAHGERSQRVGFGDDGVVARDNGLAINGLKDVVGVEAQLLHL